MLNTILVIIVCIALAMSLFIGVYALFRSQSSKKNYFLLMQLMTIVYLFGYLLEITSTTTGEAYVGVKILYLGSNFIAVMAFFFTTDFCRVKLHNVFVKLPMLLLATAVVLTMWTTNYHHLVYVDYELKTEPISRLAFTPGPLYSLTHAYPTLCMIMVMVFLLFQITKYKNKYRKALLVFLVGTAIPFIAEAVYYLTTITGINKLSIYFTPHSIAVMTCFLYMAVMRYNVFDLISLATVSAMEHIREGVILVDECHNYISSNPASVRILPGISKLTHGESIYNAGDWPRELIGLENSVMEFSVQGERVRHYAASVNPVIAQNETLSAKIILLREITDSVNLMRELENAAYIDALTGLYNRKHFAELANVDIERALRLKQSIYAVMLDLDFFKQVNDNYGHAAGDMVLKTTAAIIRQTIRSYDLLCRYGGEEFVLVITSLEPGEAFRLMERIRENMENTVTTFEDHDIVVTCSIGLAKFAEGDTLERAVRKSDDALYDAKHSGRNVVKMYQG